MNAHSATRLRAQLCDGEFLSVVRHLRDQIETVKIQVIRSAERRREMEECCRIQNCVQVELNRLSVLQATADYETVVEQQNESIMECHRENGYLDRLSDRLWRPSENELALNEFFSVVREALQYIPSSEPRFREIASHIERLRLWPETSHEAAQEFNQSQSLYQWESVDSGVLDASGLAAELDKLKYRLGEFSPPLVDQKRRQRIVGALQTKLRCNSRVALSIELAIDESALRAAMRGDLDHGGKAAESKVLLACQASDVDVTGW